jgi:hypothetical protein
VARGTVVGECVVSQASTDSYRAGHDAALGEKKPGQRGRWIYDPQTKTLVRAEDYRPPPAKCGTQIIADRIHEGTTFHDGNRVVDIGSRAKRRAFMRENGVTEASDYSPQFREQAVKQRERALDRRTESAAEAAARKLYHAGKMRD